MWNIPRVLLVASAAVLLLAGCVQRDAIVTPAPVPSATPLFANEQEALAAAEKAYAAYQGGLDVAFASYDESALAQVASNRALEKAKDSVAEFRANDKHQIGNTTVDTISFVDGSAALDPIRLGEEVQIYACLDVSNTDVRDRNNLSAVSPERPDRYSMLVSLKWSAKSHVLVVAREDAWGGTNFC